jgi:branched-chain amino acid transport system permease protein
MFLLIERWLNGLQFGLLLFLLAAGLTLVFGITEYWQIIVGLLLLLIAVYGHVEGAPAGLHRG